MPIKMNTNDFISKATKVHGNRYSYSKVIYQGYETPVTIVCGKHGRFQQTPRIHLVGKSDCQKCALEESSSNKYLTTNEFIRRATNTHSNKYDYSLVEYVKHSTKVKIKCNTCKNIFLMRPANHISGQGCPACGRVNAGMNGRIGTEKFIERMKEKFGGTFTYEKTIVGVLRDRVIITCREHGDFESNADSLLDTSIACPTCLSKVRSEIGKGMYTESTVSKNREQKCKFYIVKLFNDEESFYKIGITTQQKVIYRFSKHRIVGYNIEILYEEDTNLNDAYRKEQSGLKELKLFQYIPKRKFEGYRECFSVNPLKSISLGALLH